MTSFEIRHRVVLQADGSVCGASTLVRVGFGVGQRVAYLARAAASDPCVRQKMLGHEGDHNRSIDATTLASDPEGSRLRDKLLLLASVSRDYEPPPIDARLRTLQENLSRRERPALDRALGSVNRVMTRRRCRSQPTSRAPADCWRPSPSSVSPRIRELEHRHPRSRPAKLSLTRRLLKRWPSTSSPG